MYAVTRFTKKTLMKINLFWSCENPFEYINDCEKFNETTLPEREDFYSHLNMQDTTMQIKRTQKEFVKMLQ